MEKKWIIVSFIVLIIAVAATTYYVSSRQHSVELLSEANLSNPNLLADTEAILYFSTTADQDMNRDGLSFAVFVDSEGKTKLWEMDGLELGTVFATEDTIFLEDRGHVYLATSDGTETFSMPTEEHTGEVTDFNEDEGFFYSIYNSGFTEDGGYMSNIRFGNEEGFDTVHVPYYLQMSGLADGDLLMMTGEPENVSLQKMPLQKEVEIEEIVSLGPLGERIGMASILKEGQYYYLVMADTEKLTSDVYRIHEKTKEIETFPLFRYKDIDDYIVRIPYNLRNAATVHDGVLYYVDGIGEVHAFNSVTGEARVAFSLEGASQGQMKMSEQTYFQDGKLHFFRYQESSGSHAIDTYDLRTGDLLNELPVEGLNDMFNYVQQKKKRVSPYDFVVR